MLPVGCAVKVSPSREGGALPCSPLLSPAPGSRGQARETPSSLCSPGHSTQLRAPCEDLPGSRPPASPPRPRHPFRRYPQGPSWCHVTRARMPVRGALSAWQPPMAPPASLWRQGAPPFPVCHPLWVSGFPSTQTQSQVAPISCVAPGKSPTHSGCQLSHPPSRDH